LLERVFLWWGFVIGQLILYEKLSGVFRSPPPICFLVKCLPLLLDMASKLGQCSTFVKSLTREVIFS